MTERIVRPNFMGPMRTNFSPGGTSLGNTLIREVYIYYNYKLKKNIYLKINKIIGFHELFRAIRKLNKGNFASVYLAERWEDRKMFAVKAFSK